MRTAISREPLSIGCRNSHPGPRYRTKTVPPTAMTKRPEHKDESWSQLLGTDLARLIDDMGSEIGSVEAIGRLVSPVSARAAFKVCLIDGRILKARRVESARRCEVLATIWPLIQDLPFSRGLAHRRASLLEQWLPGRDFSSSQVTRERLIEAGDLLGRLHRLSLAAQLAPKLAATTRRARESESLLRPVEERLGALAALGIFSDKEAQGLLQRARRHCPEQLEIGLIHPGVRIHGPIWLD